jgi:hypothetical protein
MVLPGFAPPPSQGQQLYRRLDGVVAQLQGDAAVEGWERFIALCAELQAGPAPSWRAARTVIRAHPIHGLALEDPFTRQGWDRPRARSGDAGLRADARLMDRAYGIGPVAGTRAGRALNAHLQSGSFCGALRERRQLVAELVDATAARLPQPAILALGADHLREAALSVAAGTGRLGRWVALDPDPAAVAEIVRACTGLPAVQPARRTVSQMLARPAPERSFDFIHATRLLDELDPLATRRLLQGALAALRPGGQLLLSSLAPGLAVDGYLDACLDWRPLRREEADVAALLAALPAGMLADGRIFRGQSPDLVHALLTRA